MVKPRYIKHPYCIYVGNPGFSGAMEFGFGFMNNMGFSQVRDIGKKTRDRIICIGGSTTELNIGSDVWDSYPGWLQRYVGDEYEVINAGVCGYTSAEMLINFELRLLDLKPDHVVIYEAVNDVLYAGMVEGFKSDYSHSRVNLPDWTDRDLTECINIRPRVAVKEYPQEAVDTFKRNVNSICSVAKASGVNPIIVKFNYNPIIEEATDIYPLRQLGLGGSEKVFLDGLKRNIAILKDANGHYIETDLMDSSDFIDSFHFSINGMKKIAKAISNAVELCAVR